MLTSYIPTQDSPLGVGFDFQLGARVWLPEDNRLRVRLIDLDTGKVILAGDEGQYGGMRMVQSDQRYFVRVRIEIWGGEGLEFAHDYDARGRDVLVWFPEGTLGDTLGWFPYAARFAEVHGCRLTCAMSPLIIPLLRDAYPHIRFVTHDDVQPDRFYATYAMGLCFDEPDRDDWQPQDHRVVGLHRIAGYVLGVDPTEAPPRLALPDESRPIPEPYVCVAAQATGQHKHWNNPTGWRDVVAFLKASGFRVICIDQRRATSRGAVWNGMPPGAEDETGDRPLVERARWLRHASAFVGLSSGLSWLAWAAGAPVVMVSGFTLPHTEFATPYRVFNDRGCTGCWNDPSVPANRGEFLWCPRLGGTGREFECSRLITGAQVIATIRTIPGFGEARRPECPRAA